jgi:putative transcription factor
MTVTNQTFQDWSVVSFDKRKSGGGIHAVSKKQAITQAQRSGTSTSTTRTNVSMNKSSAYTGSKNMRKLDESTDEYKHEKVHQSFSKALQNARLSKKMTQKQLAQLINEKPQVVAEYESCRAIPNGQIINKLSRALSVALSAKGKNKTTQNKAQKGKA